MAHIIKQYTQAITPLATMGEQMVKSLEDYLKKEFDGEFSTTLENPTTLVASYFGYKIRFRIEIILKQPDGEKYASETAKLSAYSLSYHLTPNGTPEETLLGSCIFEKYGNVRFEADVRQTHTVGDYGSWFLFYIFNSALQKGITMRPGVV